MKHRSMVDSDFEIQSGLYVATIILVLIGVGIATFVDFGANNIWAGGFDIFVLIIASTMLLLHKFGIITRNSSLSILIYACIINFLSESVRMLILKDAYLPIQLMFNLFSATVFMGVAGFIVNRTVSLIVGLFMTGFSLTVVIVSQDPFLFSIVYLMPLLLLGYGYILFSYRGGLEGILGQLRINNIVLEQQKDELKALKEETDIAYAELKRTQNRVIAQEKLASLGALTAGIAHEIKNPLNFITNFAQSSIELMAELEEHIGKIVENLSVADKEDVEYLISELKQNMLDISQHGERGDRIVKSMLLHSRGGDGVFTAEDVNLLVEECINFAFHGLRAVDTQFQSGREYQLDKSMGLVDLARSDFSRVILNLCNNAFYAVNKRRLASDATYQPMVRLHTRLNGSMVEIKVEDNGMGMSDEIKSKVFQPFFTTKPTGEGTGLGLSISHDIIVQEHSGTLDVESTEGIGTTFIINIPCKHV